MALLDGVVAEWDNSEVVRQRVRDKHLLFVPLPLDEKAVPTVQCGEMNYDALKPLVKRLQHDGIVGQHSVPHIKLQIFSCMSFFKQFSISSLVPLGPNPSIFC